MSVSWTTIESALTAWVLSGSGLASGKVIWAKQGGDRPATPYIALDLTTVDRLGQDWVDIEDSAEPVVAGEEIAHVARGMREYTLTLQCFAATPKGTSGAVQILENVVSSLRLPAVRSALDTANVSVARIEPIAAAGGEHNYVTFEPRAIVRVRGFLVSEVSEVGTYIETADLENDPPWGP